MSDMENELKKLKVPELRERCNRLGLESKGTKGVLIERILSHHGLALETTINETLLVATSADAQTATNTGTQETINTIGSPKITEHKTSEMVQSSSAHVTKSPIKELEMNYPNTSEMITEDLLQIHASDEEIEREELDFVDEHMRSDKSDTDSENNRNHSEKFGTKRKHTEITCELSPKSSPRRSTNKLSDNLISNEHKMHSPIKSVTDDKKEKPAKIKKSSEEKMATKILSENELKYCVPPKYYEHVHLDPYVADMQLKLEDDEYLTASHFGNEFAHFYCGVKGTHGFTAGYLCYSVKIIERCKDSENKPLAGSICIGYSSKEDSLHLGDSATSFGLDSTGRILHENKIITTVATFDVGDQITALVNFQANSLTFTFQINGIDVGNATTIEVTSPLVIYPHIYFKNYKFSANFKFSSGVHGSLESITRALIPNHRPPTDFETCEIIIMVGLIGAGKTTWVQEFMKKSSTRYYAIGRQLLYDRWRKIWEEKTGKLSERIVNPTITKMVEIASRKYGNYIIDQTNVSSTSRTKRLEVFKNFGLRKCVVIIPRLSEHAKRFEKYRQELNKGLGDAKEIHPNDLISCKERFVLPTKAEGFSEVVYIDTDDKGALEIAADYKYEASQYKSKSDKKRPRILPPGGGEDSKVTSNSKPSVRPSPRKRSPKDISRSNDRRIRSPPKARSAYTSVGKTNRDRNSHVERRRMTPPHRQDTDFYDGRRSNTYRTQHDDYKSKSFISASQRTGYAERDAARLTGYANTLFNRRGHIDHRPHLDFGRSSDTRGGNDYQSWNSAIFGRERSYPARPYPDRGVDKYPRPPPYGGDMKPSSRYDSYPKRGGDRPRY